MRLCGTYLHNNTYNAAKTKLPGLLATKTSWRSWLFSVHRLILSGKKNHNKTVPKWDLEKERFWVPSACALVLSSRSPTETVEGKHVNGKEGQTRSTLNICSKFGGRLARSFLYLVPFCTACNSRCCNARDFPQRGVNSVPIFSATAVPHRRAYNLADLHTALEERETFQTVSQLC